VFRDPDPEAVEEAFQFERVAQEVGVKALAQQEAVGVRVAHDDANFVRREACKGPAFCQQAFALAHEQAIHRHEALDELLRVVGRVDLFRAEAGAVRAAGQFRPLTRNAHLVRPRVLKFDGALRRRLPRDRAQPAHVEPFVPLLREHALRQEADAQD
jgi:hypothetical protein